MLKPEIRSSKDNKSTPSSLILTCFNIVWNRDCGQPYTMKTQLTQRFATNSRICKSVIHWMHVLIEVGNVVRLGYKWTCLQPLLKRIQWIALTDFHNSRTSKFMESRTYSTILLRLYNWRITTLESYRLEHFLKWD